MTKLLKAALAATALFATPALAAPPADPDTQMARLLAGRVAGQPVNCIPLNNVRSSEIIEGRAIVYRVGSTLYVNEPRSGAEWLDRDDILVTRTPGTQLCSIETVRLVDRTSRIERGFVTLGRFVPYTKRRAG